MPTAQAADFIPLGDLDGGVFSSRATDVSADGSVVVGFGASASGAEAFRWTSAGMVGLGDLPGGGFTDFESRAYDVSADGNVVVGWSWSSSGIEAFRWTSGAGMVGLGDLPGGAFESQAHGVSSDGSVVVGGGIGASGIEAFRWTSGTGLVGLGDVPGGDFWSGARGLSDDGSVVVGFSGSTSGFEATRWTSATGMVGLGDLAGGEFSSRAIDVSADGSVVVGWSSSASGMEAYRWTSGAGMVGLGDLPGGNFESEANGVSADGSVVVGTGVSASSSPETEAFVWTPDNGMQSLRDVLVANGATGLEGWVLGSAEAISADGQWVVGTGKNPSGFTEAFLANISAGSGATSGPDHLFGTPGNDTLDGLGGADVMTGLAGDDIYIVDNIADTVVESADEGTDTIKSSVTYSLPANVENLILTGTSPIRGSGNGLANTLTGNSGNNQLNGRGGADLMRGKAGNDIYFVDNIGDRVTEGVNQGTDTIRSTISRVLPANVENLTLIGAAAINGTGNTLANRIIGNGAANILNGKEGNDTLTGGDGEDRFLFATALSISTNVDRITDFSPVDDTIRLQNAVFTGLPTAGMLAAAAFTLGTAATSAAHRVIYDPATGDVYYDADGVGGVAALRFATLTTKPAVTRTEFFVQ